MNMSMSYLHFIVISFSYLLTLGCRFTYSLVSHLDSCYYTPQTSLLSTTTRLAFKVHAPRQVRVADRVIFDPII